MTQFRTTASVPSRDSAACSREHETEPGGSFDYATLQPELNLEQTAGGVLIRWEWPRESRFVDLLEIQVDRGLGAGFVLLGCEITPHCLDTHSITVAAYWTYRAIFRLRAARVGQWSAPVSIHVAP